MSQTNIQKANKIQFGSGKFEISQDGIEWINLGAMRNILWSETWTEVRVPSDNAGEVKVGIKDHFASLSGDVMELDLEKFAIMRGGIDDYSKTEGVSETLTSGGLTTMQAIQARVTNENAAGEIFRATIFKASTAKGIELALNSDEADDPNMANVELKGALDVSRERGKQLFELYNEQGETVAS